MQCSNASKELRETRTWGLVSQKKKKKKRTWGLDFMVFFLKKKKKKISWFSMLIKFTEHMA